MRFSQGRVTQRQQWDFAEDTALNSCRAAMGRLQLLLCSGPAVDAHVAHWSALDWHLAPTWVLPDFCVRRAAAVLTLQTGA